MSHIYTNVITDSVINITDSNGFCGELEILRCHKLFDWSPKSLDLGVIFICMFLTPKSKYLGLQTMILSRPKI